jgi:hypothetical protein
MSQLSSPGRYLEHPEESQWLILSRAIFIQIKHETYTNRQSRSIFQNCAWSQRLGLGKFVSNRIHMKSYKLRLALQQGGEEGARTPPPTSNSRRRVTHTVCNDLLPPSAE